MRKSSVLLPNEKWELLARIAELSTEAWAMVKGTTQATVSDEIESAVDGYFESIVETFGPLPGENATPEERREYVKRWADYRLNQLRAQLHSKTSK